jgi:[ribosomal protein S18]-alanine N-acetyltransferase
VTVRPATSDDVEAVHGLERLLFGLDAWSRESVRDEVLADHLVVCGEGETVMGYVATSPAGEVLDLLRIGVHPQGRRAGVGTLLLAQVPTTIPVLLEVSAANQGAIAFYVARGFVEIDRRRRYYRDGTDAVVMRRTAQ